MNEIIIEAKAGRSGWQLQELWRYRDLLLLLAKRDVTIRYRQTLLGAAWALLQPLATVGIFTLIFGRLAGMPSDGIPYSLFAFAGLLPWLFFSSALNAAGNSVVNSSNLVTKVYFPRLIIPVSAIGAPLVDLAITMTFMLVMLWYHGMSLTLQILWLPPLLLLTALTAIGMGTLVAALTVNYRDFRHILPPLTTLWMFMTPIIYPASLIPEDWRWLLFLNPMSGIVGGIRSAWFGTEFDLLALGYSTSIAVLFLIVGISYFRVTERRFADIV